MNGSADILGIMSGTSLDGVDLALCRFSENGAKFGFQILCAETVPLPEEWMHILKNPFTLSGSELARYHAAFGTFLGKTAKDFLERNLLSADLIASHGHTLYHEPQNGFTFQLGHGAAIAHASGTDTVSDFRSGDVALGGQGAPLVPIGDELLFGEYDGCLNLGGFANISLRNDQGRRIGFDICPCNYVLNRLAERLNLPYDAGGKLASAGKEITKLAAELDRLDFYHTAPPKSLGAEWAEKHIIPLLGEENTLDLLHTLTRHVARQISNTIRLHGLRKVLVTGGGAKNSFLLETLRSAANAEIVIPNYLTVDFKEALIFAFLGYLRMKGKTNIVASVTGASRDSCAGAFYKA